MSDLNVSIEEGVARVVFDRPSTLNALSPTLLSALVDVCADLAHDDSLRVVVFGGAASCFSAGADLPAFLGLLTGADAHATADLGRRATNAIAATIARKPLGVLRITKRQLIAVRTGTFDPCADADALLSSLKDPEALAVGQRYLMERIGKK
jgi:enoyl-CoA hydratase/carnithine racemase